MDKNYKLLDDGTCIIKDYNQTNAFSNFLPGIGGAWGVPIWVFYVNRAQGVISFGLQDKDHCIGEFFPANKAYALVSNIGFRTFLKINGKTFHEPFRVVSGHKRDETMAVRSSSLEILKINHHLGLQFSVKYFTIPSTMVGGLVRMLSIKNISGKKINLEIIDGLPRIIPFGSNNLFLKDLARTLEAWIHSYVKDNIALFRLIVDPVDASQTKLLQGANFNYSFYEEAGKIIHPYMIVDPDTLFGQDASYSVPVKFLKDGFKTPLAQIYCGKTPSSLSHFIWKLEPEEEKIFYSTFGASFKLDLIKKFTSAINADFIRNKEKENEEIITAIQKNALCVSESCEFNHYVGYTYMDNVLRGGFPYSPQGSSSVYYIFSRKHGDLERDYNKFKLLPSYFSEGEANYRDINQNRRMDLFFNPAIEKKNVIYFLNFIKIDGYNPLVVKGENLFFKRNEAQALLQKFGIKKDERLIELMVKGFQLGNFFKFLKEEGIGVEKREELAKILIETARREPAASFGEGYWIDHWRYNLDLIESFLYFYPDKANELFMNKDYYFWDDEYRVRDRSSRYLLKDSKVYQANSLEQVEEKKALLSKRLRGRNFLRTKDGVVYKTNMVVKLLSLILNKSATLDPDGIGVEMEADKPGWCDSLNGLPALFGSSLCETLEIKRACIILRNALEELKIKKVSVVAMPVEIASFLNRMQKLVDNYLSSASRDKDYIWWDKANLIKEDFRKVTFLFIEGIEKEVRIAAIEKFLEKLEAKLDIAIEKAKDKSTGTWPTYFRYEIAQYKRKRNKITPLSFVRKDMPLFLEGFVNLLRVKRDKEIYKALKNSVLFDKELKMYRLNASLAKEPLEIGRSRIFVPGWLENESIWLHMEYKYLLEVLRSGLYEDFYEDLRNCCVCFFEPMRYGRSILENSSFIVSSAHPDKSLWGKGFVARLSGATVELLHIWILLCLGRQPFSCDKSGSLSVSFKPILKAELFTHKEKTILFKGKKEVIGKNCFAFNLFSSILVVYHNPNRRDTFPDCRIAKIVVQACGREATIESSVIKAPLSNKIREGKADRIDVYIL
ncbi:MAG: hypothetical protein PHQ96_07045 [Candidatus Omnitrophica bacterium]|nr:hypothetical protein [Candidatus Omnitrophota bacterium]